MYGIKFIKDGKANMENVLFLWKSVFTDEILKVVPISWHDNKVHCLFSKRQISVSHNSAVIVLRIFDIMHYLYLRAKHNRVWLNFDNKSAFWFIYLCNFMDKTIRALIDESTDPESVLKDVFTWWVFWCLVIILHFNITEIHYNCL